jgi:hypothetical protein
MRRKRIKPCAKTRAKGGGLTADTELVRLAAVLVQIAAMDALPLASSPPRQRKHRCAT